MYQQFYADGLFLHFPLIALAVFMTVFAGVVAWALFFAPREATRERLQRLASQPLFDESEARHE